MRHESIGCYVNIFHTTIFAPYTFTERAFPSLRNLHNQKCCVLFLPLLTIWNTRIFFDTLFPSWWHGAFYYLASPKAEKKSMWYLTSTVQFGNFKVGEVVMGGVPHRYLYDFTIQSWKFSLPCCKLIFDSLYHQSPKQFLSWVVPFRRPKCFTGRLCTSQSREQGIWQTCSSNPILSRPLLLRLTFRSEPSRRIEVPALSYDSIRIISEEKDSSISILKMKHLNPVWLNFSLWNFPYPSLRNIADAARRP